MMMARCLNSETIDYMIQKRYSEAYGCLRMAVSEVVQRLKDEDANQARLQALPLPHDAHHLGRSVVPVPIEEPLGLDCREGMISKINTEELDHNFVCVYERAFAFVGPVVASMDLAETGAILVYNMALVDHIQGRSSPSTRCRDYKGAFTKYRIVENLLQRSRTRQGQGYHEQQNHLVHLALYNNLAHLKMHSFDLEVSHSFLVQTKNLLFSQQQDDNESLVSDGDFHHFYTNILALEGHLMQVAPSA